jgi:hypothetical protein
MKLMFPHATFQALGKAEVDILIAGCGTGVMPSRSRGSTAARRYRD